MEKPRILTLDIETRPSLAYTWSLWDVNIGINQLTESAEMFSFAAKWYDERKVQFYSTNDVGKDAMIDKAYELVDEADIIVHFNGRTFDVPHLRREWLLAGKTPTSPFLQVDLLQVVRSNFKFPSNKLDYVAQALGVGKKTSHTGFELWAQCMKGDQDAWKLMEKYNKQDVRITEAVYDKLKPWMKGQPHAGLFNGIEHCCPSCGSENLQRRGPAYTPNMVYQQYRCNDCGSWSRSAKKDARTTTRPNNA